MKKHEEEGCSGSGSGSGGEGKKGGKEEQKSIIWEYNLLEQNK